MNELRKILILVFIFIGICVIAITASIKYENKHSIIPKPKTYEQGLWDGANGAFMYVLRTKQIKDDTLHVEITKLDSILHNLK
jgi:hypothetical protein